MIIHEEDFTKLAEVIRQTAVVPRQQRLTTGIYQAKLLGVGQTLIVHLNSTSTESNAEPAPPVKINFNDESALWTVVNHDNVRWSTSWASWKWRVVPNHGDWRCLVVENNETDRELQELREVFTFLDVARRQSARTHVYPATFLRMLTEGL